MCVGSLACVQSVINARRSSILISKLAKWAATSAGYSSSGEHARVPPVFCFLPGRFKARKKANASGDQKGEKYAAGDQLLFGSLSRGLVVVPSLPLERYICHKPWIDKCSFGPWTGPRTPDNLRAYFELFKELTVSCTFLYYCL